RLALFALFAVIGDHAGTTLDAPNISSIAAPEQVNDDSGVDPIRAIRLAVLPRSFDRTSGLEAHHSGADIHRSRLGGYPEALSSVEIGQLAFATAARNVLTTCRIPPSDIRCAFAPRGPPRVG